MAAGARKVRYRDKLGQAGDLGLGCLWQTGEPLPRPRQSWYLTASEGCHSKWGLVMADRSGIFISLQEIQGMEHCVNSMGMKSAKSRPWKTLQGKHQRVDLIQTNQL